MLVYTADAREPDKQAQALGLLRRLVAEGGGGLSSQVLAEFFRVVTQRLRPPVPADQAADQVAVLAQAWPVLPITTAIVLEATRGVCAHRLPYWDAQVWATARLNQVATVLSEDFEDGRTLEGVTFRNPFRPGFSLP